MNNVSPKLDSKGGKLKIRCIFDVCIGIWVAESFNIFE